MRQNRPNTPAATAKRIMVVDDHRDTVETLVELLNLHGYDARAIYDGPSALRELPRFRPDALLVDIELPGMDGCELARMVRAIPGATAIHLVAITGYDQESDRRRAKDAGFDAYLVKPIELESLLSLLSAGPA